MGFVKDLNSLQVKLFGRIIIACLFGSIGLVAPVHADQVIYVRVADFDPALSAFGVEVAGNIWVETQEEGALFGTAYGAPGDNNKDPVGPHLVIKLPTPVEPGEATSDGKTWDAWARMYLPGALFTGNLNNSMFFRTSPDAKKWTPSDRGSSDLLWNDPGGKNNTLLFPDLVNGVDSLFTDVGDTLPWLWVRHKATVNGPRAPDSKIDPVLEVGDNYVELVPRESDPELYPRIEVICFRNDGGFPSDAEAKEFFKRIMDVEPKGKLPIIWGALRSLER